MSVAVCGFNFRAVWLQIEDGGNIDVLCENSMDAILAQLYERRPKAVIVDSVQTVSLSSVAGGNGSVSQVRASSVALLLLLLLLLLTESLRQSHAHGFTLGFHAISIVHSSVSGSLVQVRECAKALVTVCKQTLGIPAFLVGHVTKGGDIAGPKTLEHIVDTTLYLEGEEGSSCRLLRANKNRSATCHIAMLRA